jgi:hypothetical protein
MMNQSEKRIIKHKVRIFLALLIGFLGMSTLAAFQGFSVYQKRQYFFQSETDEKLYNWKQYSSAFRKDYYTDQYTNTLNPSTKNDLAMNQVLFWINDSSEITRFALVEALSSFKSRDVIPYLLILVKDSNFYVRYSASKALKDLQGDILIHQEESYIANHKSLLGKNESLSEENISYLIALLKNSNSYARSGAAKILGNLRVKKSAPALVTLLEESKVFSGEVDGDFVTSFKSEKIYLDSFEVAEYSSIDYLKHVRESAITALDNIYSSHYQKSNITLWVFDGVRNNMILQSLFSSITTSILLLYVSLLLTKYFRHLRSITYLMYLDCFFPEEFFSELVALNEELTSKKASSHLVKIILIRSIAELVWACYKIKIDNILSPPKNRGIDE